MADQIMLWRKKILTVNGKIAISPACCCESGGHRRKHKHKRKHHKKHHHHHKKKHSHSHTNPNAGACCMPDGTCKGGMVQLDCINAGGVWQGVGTKCKDAHCPANCPACDENCQTLSAGKSYTNDGICSGKRYHVGTYSNPIDGPAWVVFTGYVNDDLVVDGEVWQPSGYECTYIPGYSISPCNCAHGTTFCKRIKQGASVRIHVQNNFDPGWGLNGTLCFCPADSPAP
jgi:hypothetical protein